MRLINIDAFIRRESMVHPGEQVDRRTKVLDSSEMTKPPNTRFYYSGSAAWRQQPCLIHIRVTLHTYHPNITNLSDHPKPSPILPPSCSPMHSPRQGIRRREWRSGTSSRVRPLPIFLTQLHAPNTSAFSAVTDAFPLIHHLTNRRTCTCVIIKFHNQTLKPVRVRLRKTR